MVPTAQPTLSVQDLRTYFFTKRGVVKAVDGVSFTLQAGEVMGLVGESGSGKSVTGFSIMGLVDAPGKIIGGRVLFQGEDLLAAKPDRLRQLRGHRLAMIFQDPLMTLNPVLRIDTQLVEAIRAHENIDRRGALIQAREALARVGIPSPEARLKNYPHQFSGGMRQRVAIAIAMLHKPDLIIADEPTTALDVTIQGQILFEVQKLCRESGTALIWITHDLAVASMLADRLSVMYGGRIVESGTIADVLDRPAHPYTHGLIGSAPGRSDRGKPLFQIPGMPVSLLELPSGCSFRPRCERALESCEIEPTISQLPQGRELRCFNPYPPVANE